MYNNMSLVCPPHYTSSTMCSWTAACNSSCGGADCIGMAALGGAVKMTNVVLACKIVRLFR